MQRVIEIDEETYNEIKKIVANGNEMCFMQALIANSTPLPKGHGDLIDRDDLTSWMTEVDRSYRAIEVIAKCEVDKAPTIIEADKEDV